MMRSVPTWRAKAAALTTVLIATLAVLLLREVAEVALYLALLMAVGVLVALFASVRLWRGGTWDCRVLAGGLSLIGLVGIALNLVVGLPGASSLSDGASSAGVLAALLEVATLTLLAEDVFGRPPKPDRQRPYAL